MPAQSYLRSPNSPNPPPISISEWFAVCDRETRLISLRENKGGLRSQESFDSENNRECLLEWRLSWSQPASTS